MDFVSEEAEIAGKSAAEYINGTLKKTVNIPIKTDGKVRYSVPQMITREKDITVYFRVSDVFHNVKINVKNENGELVFSKRRTKAVPGEMESITIKEDKIKNAKELYIELEV